MKSRISIKSNPMDSVTAIETTALGRRGPNLLTKAEFEHVAAGGSKPGIGSGTDERPPHRPH